MPRQRRSTDLVTTPRRLLAEGVSRTQLATELRAGRWRRLGHIVVLHNGPLSLDQRRRVAQLHAGPGALLTAFTAATVMGLQGWDRDAVHLLAAAGTRMRSNCPVPVRLHLHGATPIRREPGMAVEFLPDALLRAAATFDSARPGCGLLAAGVQQRLVTADLLADALERAPRVRHRAALRSAVIDIGGGSQALSEIDFVRLCRRNGLPEPRRQRTRREPSGRVRYLDAEWLRPDGRKVVVEVDGALHLTVRRWWDDQLRQNEIAIADTIVLRFPSVVIRLEEALVVDQLRRVLLL
ncbi:hypothetical protein [Jatrophihabitans endophyticus]|uniref:hypothetical protein n=1 Tax=Jatrophihabitans endophyticus TaxID=1206085 RepID=UPI0019DCFEB1|nr:hypothetical protein [Jatrophihabitans endophyticus]MBE7188411.1 hypothetical protein [Jatrophihabitans endophyticus]